MLEVEPITTIAETPIAAGALAQKKRHRTQWAAQFAVASELCKRGYEVAFTQGNSTPLADLMCVSPETKTMFLIDVKGLSVRSGWMVKDKPARDGLFYILAFVPAGGDNRFFIVPQADVNRLIDEYRASGIRYLPTHPSGFNWTTPAAFEAQWNLLPL
jgi:hypothetical protein